MSETQLDITSKPNPIDYGFEGEPVNLWWLESGEDEYNDDLKEWELQEAHDACGDKD